MRKNQIMWRTVDDSTHLVVITQPKSFGKKSPLIFAIPINLFDALKRDLVVSTLVHKSELSPYWYETEAYR